MRRYRFADFAPAVLSLLALAGCTAFGGARAWQESPWRWAAPRTTYIQRSQVWLGGDLYAWVEHMRGLDLRAGPNGDDAFAFEDLVRCELAQSPVSVGGATPKFLCQRQRNGTADVFKVKWGADNGEVYAEVVGTRLFWALGFASDSVYPVRVECTGCADDPWRDRELHEGHVPDLFAPAVIEREFPGSTMEEGRDQGWTWAEFRTIDPALGGAPRAHTEAMQLLAAFVQHRDSKADNQRLVCLLDGVTAGASGRSDCLRPVMMIHDMGSMFGGPSLFGTHKMDLDAWSSEPLWRNAERCIANLHSERDASDGLEEPHIDEEGRLFLLALLDALDQDQIAALFDAARAGERGGVSRWVAAFEQRREQVRHPVPSDPSFRCADRPLR